MEIPYAVHPRRDTGLYNAKVGIWLFLASEVMLFGGLFSAYVLLRVGAVDGYWPHGWLNVTLGTLNTLILALSAITTLLAWVACKVGQFGKFKFFHACTLALALSFLCVKMYEYHDKWIHYEIQLTDGLDKLIAQGQPFHGMRVSARRFDCGYKLGYLEANVALGLQHPQLGEPFRSLLKTMI